MFPFSSGLSVKLNNNKDCNINLISQYQIHSEFLIVTKVLHTFDKKSSVLLILKWSCDDTGVLPRMSFFNVVDFEAEVAFLVLIREHFNSVIVFWSLVFSCSVASNYIDHNFAVIVSPVYINIFNSVLKLAVMDKTWQEYRASNKTLNGGCRNRERL